MSSTKDNGKSTWKKPSKRTKASVVVNVTDCKYDAVRKVAKAKGWTLLDEYEEEGYADPNTSRTTRTASSPSTAWWNIYWTDTSVAAERVMRMTECQKINHFPGMYHLSRKGGLGRQLGTLKRIFPNDFRFVPPTWILPAEWSSFRQQFTRKANRTFIIKPDASCQGKGIFLTRTWENVNPTEPQVAQRYLHKPLLIDKCKFDMRVYVLVSSVCPLKLYLFHEGLIRICTEEYVEPTGKNLGKVCMHLTNYSINKESEKFVPNKHKDSDHVGNKRSLSWFRQHLQDIGHDPTELWGKMQDLIIKTMISGLPFLQQTYQSCVRPGRTTTPPTPKVPTNMGAHPATSRSRTSQILREPKAPTSTLPVCASSKRNASMKLTHGKGSRTVTEQRCESITAHEGRASQTRTSSNGSNKPLSLHLVGHKHIRNADSQHMGNYGPKRGIPGNSYRRASPLQATAQEGEGPPHRNATPPLGTACNKTAGVHGKKTTSTETTSSCFEILGFDIMVDRKLQPWLIEVNHSPSFACDTPLDTAIKTELIDRTLSLLNVRASDRRKTQRKHMRAAQTRLYGGPVKLGRTRPRTASSNGSRKTKRTLTDLERLRRTEEKCTADGVFTKIFPTSNRKMAEYYQQLILASSELNRTSTMGRTSSRETAANFEHYRESVRNARRKTNACSDAESIGE